MMLILKILLIFATEYALNILLRHPIRQNKWKWKVKKVS